VKAADQPKSNSTLLAHQPEASEPWENLQSKSATGSVRSRNTRKITRPFGLGCGSQGQAGPEQCCRLPAFRRSAWHACWEKSPARLRFGGCQANSRCWNRKRPSAKFTLGGGEYDRASFDGGYNAKTFHSRRTDRRFSPSFKTIKGFTVGNWSFDPAGKATGYFQETAS